MFSNQKKERKAFVSHLWVSVGFSRKRDWHHATKIYIHLRRYHTTSLCLCETQRRLKWVKLPCLFDRSTRFHSALFFFSPGHYIYLLSCSQAATNKSKRACDIEGSVAGTFWVLCLDYFEQKWNTKGIWWNKVWDKSKTVKSPSINKKTSQIRCWKRKRHFKSSRAQSFFKLEKMVFWQRNQATPFTNPVVQAKEQNKKCVFHIKCTPEFSIIYIYFYILTVASRTQC